MASLQVNGSLHDVATHPAAALLWALRDELGCTSVKYGCGTEQCGACRVLVPVFATCRCGRRAYSRRSTRFRRRHSAQRERRAVPRVG